RGPALRRRCRDRPASAAPPAGGLAPPRRLLDEAAPPLSSPEVTALLRLLGGSPALAAALAAEGGGWPVALRGVLTEERRDPAAHRRALEALRILRPLARDMLPP